jgi:hypothetical protein
MGWEGMMKSVKSNKAEDLFGEGALCVCALPKSECADRVPLCFYPRKLGAHCISPNSGNKRHPRSSWLATIIHQL